MVISLYNMGVEYEYLNEYSNSLEAFSKAFNINTEYLNDE